MSKIEELLENEKVEWKKLGLVSEVGTGKSNTNEQVEEGKYPFYVRSKNIKRSNQFEFDETAIIIPGEGGIGEVFHFVVGKYALHQRAYRIHIIQKNISTKYVYYYMIQKFKKYILKNAVSATVSSIRKPMIENFEIPIPSPETQKKIVEILDNFTNCVTELQTELQNRIKQYEYYRNMLLSEEYLDKLSDKLGILPMEAENQIRCTTLGEIGKICMCKRILKEQTLPKGDVPFYKIGTFGKKADAFISREVFDEYKEKYSYPKKGEVLISCSGTIGRTVIFDGKDAYFQDSNIIWLSHDESIVLNKYLFYFYQNARWNATSGGTISRLYTYNLVNLNIELPSLPLQNKIVEILDRFQFMLSDTKGLLPKEIEQRQKQYEYYREKLLTFDVESDSKQASKQASKQDNC